MTSDTSKKDFLKPKHSKELLNFKNSPEIKQSEKAVFALLQEKQKAGGTYKMNPSNLLLKVKEFLPQLEKANQEIQQEIVGNPDKQLIYDIQNVEDSKGPIIEMDLALYEDSDSDSSLSSTEPGCVPDSEPNNEFSLKLPNSSVKSSLVEVLETNEESKEQ